MATGNFPNYRFRKFNNPERVVNFTPGLTKPKGSYTKEEGMQLIETAKFERLLKIALSHAHALKIIIIYYCCHGYRMNLAS